MKQLLLCTFCLICILSATLAEDTQKKDQKLTYQKIHYSNISSLISENASEQVRKLFKDWTYWIKEYTKQDAICSKSNKDKWIDWTCCSKHKLFSDERIKLHKRADAISPQKKEPGSAQTCSQVWWQSLGINHKYTFEYID